MHVLSVTEDAIDSIAFTFYPHFLWQNKDKNKAPNNRDPSKVLAPWTTRHAKRNNGRVWVQRARRSPKEEI